MLTISDIILINNINNIFFNHVKGLPAVHMPQGRDLVTEFAVEVED